MLLFILSRFQVGTKKVKWNVCVCVLGCRDRGRKSRPWVCVCVCMVYDYMSFVEHINHSCKRNHGEMRNASRALAGSRKWHWTFVYKLEISCSADMHLMKVTAFIIFVPVHPAFSPPPPPPPQSGAGPRCHGGAWTENNGGTGAPDKWELINQRRRGEVEQYLLKQRAEPSERYQGEEGAVDQGCTPCDRRKQVKDPSRSLSLGGNPNKLIQYYTYRATEKKLNWLIPHRWL